MTPRWGRFWIRPRQRQRREITTVPWRWGLQGLTDVIAADKGVTIAPVVHTYHRQAAPQQQGFGVGRIVLGILFVIVLFVLIKTGNIGWAFLLLQSVMGGGGGGGGGRDDDEGGGGFGGVGGGESGGGGASRGF